MSHAKPRGRKQVASRSSGFPQHFDNTLQGFGITRLLVYLPRYALKSIGGGELRRRPVEPPKPSLVVVVAPRHQRARAFSKVEVGAFCYVLGDRVPYRPPAAFVFARGRFRSLSASFQGLPSKKRR